MKDVNLGELIERGRLAIEDTKRLIARAEQKCEASRDRDARDDFRADDSE